MNRPYWLRQMVCIVLIAAFVLAGTASARAVSVLCSVTPAPATASTPAAYTLRVSTNPYDRVDQLRIKFPFDTEFTAGSFAPPMVVVNGVQSRGGQIQKVATTNWIQMDILLSERLSAGTPLTIVIAREAGILNPLSPRSCYRLIVSFFRDGSEINWVESDLYAITPSAISNVNAAIDPAVAGAAADVQVSFQTGSNGRLKTGQDSVNIAFPSGFSIPQALNLGGVTLNGVSCEGGVFRDNTSTNTVLVYVPVDIPAGSLVVVRIPAKVGFKSPAVAGPVILTVHTTTEVTPVDAPAVQIRGREVSGLTVQLTVPVAGSRTGLELHFGLSAVGRLTQGQLVHVRLPIGYAAPVLSGMASATVNGTATSAITTAGVIDAVVPTYLPDRAAVDLVFPVDFGIVNPVVPTGYAWTVWTDSDTAPIVSMALVQAPSASGAAFASSTRAIGRDAAWTVTFTPSSPSTFPSAGEVVTITFDEAILVPAQLGAGSVMINDVPAGAAAQGTAVVVTMPAGVASTGIVTVKMSEQAGIRTPAVPISASARVATTRDSTPASTNELAFKAMPVVTMIVTPDVPNGLSGRYIVNKPVVQLVSDNASIFYRIDDTSYLRYESGIQVSIPEGSHTLAAYAVASDGTEGEPVMRSFVVDLTRPTMSLDGYTGDILVRSPQVTLTGTVSEPVELVQVNGVPASVAQDNRFSVTVSVGDGQALVCYTRDLAGNVTNFVRTVRLDSVPPVITKAGPSMTSSTVHAEQYEVRVTVNEASTVTVNGQPMTQASPEYVATIALQKGVNEVTVRAVDAAGNEGLLSWSITWTDTLTISLTANTTTAMVGNEQRSLDAPPIIVNGVTFVPLRFIGEALGAEVTWSPALQVVFLVKSSSRVQLSVGSKLAIIDGRITQLLEAPRIQNGRTMVPLRFISEAFGADVTWDQATKAVTVSLADAT
ncbi:stalk domain-containing protein [Candidatus Cryosericum terrychapinii]|uniref:Copper amine oxidase N-terminal domain-containing protein n=1 Tax=Candidatus Cryosericum terrychapinii TaxID=2290919 RepID=A0A398CU51_9BACT|nr:stalk domain-containing protein [Candidatus Cryosericum terrychapinii]RIE06926.1 copper amine oxidase N-terminal domain-containing protein [Candidatus Cryosericum terrychapinii]